MQRLQAITLLLLLFNTTVFGKWNQVRPNVQSFVRTPSEDPYGVELDPSGVRIIYVEDSLQFVAQELAYRLSQMEGWAGHDRVTTIQYTLDELLTGGSIPGPAPTGHSEIVLLSWATEHAKSLFRPSGYTTFQDPPTGVTSKDWYYIWAEDDFIINEDNADYPYSTFSNPNVEVFVTGGSVRGVLYGVTSLWQGASLVATDELRVETGYLVDFPVFENRWTGVFFFFGNYTDWTPDPGYTREQTIGRDIIDHAYSTLLLSKADGVLHGGRSFQYDDPDDPGNHEQEYTIDVIEALADGRLYDDHLVRWQDLGLDWYEGMGWERRNQTTGYNSDYVYRTVAVQCTCSIGELNGGYVALTVDPNPVPSLRNGDFEDWRDGDETAPYQWYAYPGGTVVTRDDNGGTNNFPVITIGDGETRGIEQVIKVQPNLGSPSRQLLMTYDVSSEENGNTTSNLITSIGMYLEDCPDPPNCTDGNAEFINPGEHHNTPSLWRLSKSLRVERTSPLSSTWTTDSVTFLSMGAKSLLVRMLFKNTTGEPRHIRIDNLQIVDTEPYRIYGADTWDTEVTLVRTGETQDITSSGLLEISELSSSTDSDVYHHAGLRLPISAFSPDDPEDWDKVVIKYRTVPRTPLTLTYVPSGALPLPRFLPQLSRQEYRTNEPSAFDDVMREQMSWFEEEFDDNDLSVSGYYFVENELKSAGWMDEDDNQPVSQTNAEFASYMYDELPGNELGPEKKMIMWGDAYDPYHEGIRYSRTNNVYDPVRGNERPPATPDCEIPGFDDANKRIVFINWRGLSYDEWGDFEDSFDFWQSMVTSDCENSFEVILGLGDIRNIAEMPADREDYFHDIVLHAEAAQENGTRFTGGLPFYWQSGSHSNFDNYEGWAEWLQWLWNPHPFLELAEPPITVQTAADSTFDISAIAYPIDSIDESHMNSVDSVLLQYRLGSDLTWRTQKVSTHTDSTYDFEVDLPNTGGYLEYRLWAFTKFGNYGSHPPCGTKWSDPDAGESTLLAFERRKDSPIATRDTFWLPGVLSKKHLVENGGHLVFQPLPGYRHATLFVTNDAEIAFTPGVLPTKPYVEFNGCDTVQIHVKPLCDTCTWKGITDSAGRVNKKFVTFHEGTGEALRLYNVTGDNAASFEKAAFEDTVLVKGLVEMSGSATFNRLIVDSAATLTILPGSELSFFEGGQLIVRDGGLLRSMGNDSTAIVFKADVDSLPWEGIHCEVAHSSVACSLAYTTISGAVAGLLVDRGRAYSAHCKFENDHYGVLANNGAWVEAVSCTLTTNRVGLLATNLSSCELTDVFVTNNLGPGLRALSRSSLYLTNCAVNANHGDGLAGGIGLFTGSCAFLECTEVNGNTGSGITAYGGTVMLTSVEEVGDTLGQWHGNRIEHNETIPYEGQITLSDRTALALWNGHNSVQDTSGEGSLVQWDNPVGSDLWADTYWGSLDTAAIKALLPPNATLSRIDSSASSCPSFTSDNGDDSLVHIFLEPHNNEISALLTSAVAAYKSLILNSESSDYTKTACDRLLTCCLAQGNSFATMKDTLEALSSAANDASVVGWIENCKAWAWAEAGETGIAVDILDSLAQNTPTRFDRVAAKVQRQMVEVFALHVDTVSGYKASDCIAYIDSAQRVLESMRVWNQTTIEDSVVMYAPVTVEGLITISQPNGCLTILPHPGAEDPTVRFRSAGAIQVNGFNTGLARGRLFVQGNDDHRVNLDWDSSSAYGNIYSTRAYVNLKHANLRGTGWVNINEEPWGTNRTPILIVDSCTFSGFDEGLWLYGAFDSCSISNCTFESLGGDALGFTGMDGSGLTLYYSENIPILNCTFVDNEDAGISGFFSDNILISETEVTGSAEHGLLAWESANFTIECSNFHDNGDSLAEIWVEDGLVSLTDGFTRVADDGGVLIYAGHPTFADVEGGENGLELETTSGTYLKSGDTSATWDITFNAWVPLSPADSGFFAMLYPSDPSKWSVDSSLAQFIECGGGAGSSVGGRRLIVIGESESSGVLSVEEYGEHSKHSLDTKSQGSVRRDLSSKASSTMMLSDETEMWREFSEQAKDANTRSKAIELGMKFMDENPDSRLFPAAVVQLTSLAKHAGTKAGIASYLEQKALASKDGRCRAFLARKAWVARAYEGDAPRAIRELELLMETAPTRRDSICALADAMGIYHATRHSSTTAPTYSSIVTESLSELKTRLHELARQINGTAGKQVAHVSAIPTSYALHQNYPNPFNPTTEIRFDLPEAIHAELKVFNILGQEVVTLVDDVRNAGAYRVLWDGKNAGGMTVASGVYVYQLKTANFTNAKKMVLIR